MSKKVLAVREESVDGNWLYKLDMTKFKDAFIDSIDFEVFMEGIEQNESTVFVQLVSKKELNEAIKNTKDLA